MTIRDLIRPTITIALLGMIGAAWVGFNEWQQDKAARAVLEETITPLRARADSLARIADLQDRVIQDLNRTVADRLQELESSRERIRLTSDSLRTRTAEARQAVLNAASRPLVDTVRVRVGLDSLQAVHDHETGLLRSALLSADSVIYALRDQNTAQTRLIGNLRTQIGVLNEQLSVYDRAASGDGWDWKGYAIAAGVGAVAWEFARNR